MTTEGRDNVQVLAAVKLPRFDDDTIPGDYVLKIEQAIQANRWDDETAASHITFAMEGKALTWMRALKEEDALKANGDKVTTKWSKLKVVFLERFAPTSKTMEKRQILKSLIMTDKESPREFLDRCKVALYTLRAHVPAAERKKDGWKKTFDDEVLLTFIGGLKEPIREKIEENASLDDIEKVLKEATAIYSTRTPRNAPPTAAMSHIHSIETKQLAEEIAALHDQMRQFRGSFRGRNRGRGGNYRGNFRGRGNNGRGNFRGRNNRGNYSRGRGRGRLDQDQCARCLKKGHWKNECVASLEEEKEEGGYEEDDWEMGEDYELP